MSDLDVIYEIARYSVDGDRLIERFEVVAEGAVLRRRNTDGRVSKLKGDTAAKAIAADPALCEVRAGELTRVTTTTLVDELPLILQAPGTYPDEYDDGPGAVYDDRTVEINGHSWFIFDGYLLPTATAWESLTETWVSLAFDVGWTPFSNGVACGVIGLLNPNVVVSIDPVWGDEGHVVNVRRRGGDAGDIHGWLLCFRPEDWGGGSGLDTERLLAQLFIEASGTLGERTGVNGDYLAAGIVDDQQSFGLTGWWELTLNIAPDVAGQVLDLLAEDEEIADLVAAARDPESPTGRARREALAALSRP